MGAVARCGNLEDEVTRSERGGHMMGPIPWGTLRYRCELQTNQSPFDQASEPFWQGIVVQEQDSAAIQHLLAYGTHEQKRFTGDEGYSNGQSKTAVDTNDSEGYVVDPAGASHKRRLDLKG